MQDCLFCRIARGEIPANTLYEDDDIVAFHDINPVAPVHFLVIPKVHVASMAELGDEHAAVMGKMMVMIGKLAQEQGCDDGFRIIANTGRVGRQEVYHLHIHVLGGSDVLPAMLKR